jgi:hypothetical protein
MRTILQRLLPLAASAACLLAGAAAEAQDPLREGARIRVHRDASPAVEARLLRVTADSLTYGIGTADSIGVSVAFDEVDLEVRRGPAPGSHPVLQGAGIGALAGAAGLGALLAITYEPCRPPDVPWGGLACIGHPTLEMAFAGGALLGGLLGAVVGAAIAQDGARERWEWIEPARVTVAGAEGGRLRVAIRIRS